MRKNLKYGQPGQDTRRKRAVDQAMRTMRNWQELTVIDEYAAKPKVIARIPTLHFGLIIFILAGILTAYIGHIHRSQDLLTEINTQRRENIRLHLQHTRLVADYNSATGPSVIYERGAMLGLQTGYEDSVIIQGIRQTQP
ncbi:MAG: hypothetical protein OXE92_05125 [Bacteroidetes bacterium]|nr:hypothetical protein [Bacteroidota bacterium]MCY4205090.1 hypothetical protein [Bacteroidota bacterium]MCY4279090.1 hypothetical protein [Acidimicrobiaceae bacterium]